MAEELTSTPEAPATPNEPGQSQTSPAVPQSAPEIGQGQQTPAKVNLYELPEFKAYQQQVSRTMTDYQRRMQELEQRQHEATMATLTPEQKVQYQLQLKDQELAQFRQQAQQQQVEQQRQADIRRLSDLSGAPANIFDAAGTYDEAVHLAMAYMRENSPATVAAQKAKIEANRVDLGGGGKIATHDNTNNPESRDLARNDTRAYYKMLLDS